MDLNALDLTRIALDGTNAELRPVFDPVLRTFSVQLWKGGEPSGIHGLTDAFRYPDEPLELIDAFLAEQGVRAVTGDEAVVVYAGPRLRQGWPDWALLQMEVAASQQG
ncbi:hypothetical protein SALBM311S_11630 [Streptomyces alboniger]